MGFQLEKHSRRTDARLKRQLLVNLNEHLRRLIEDIRVFHSCMEEQKISSATHHIRDSLMSISIFPSSDNFFRLLVLETPQHFI